MWIGLEALDVLLFREGGPFEAGEAHRVSSLWPPAVTTIQGALRGRLFADRGYTGRDRVRDAYTGGGVDTILARLGTNTRLGDLRLRGPFVYQSDPSGATVVRFPAPADCLVSRGNSRYYAGYYLKPVERIPRAIRAGHPGAPVQRRLVPLKSRAGSAAPEGRTISLGQLGGYLAGLPGLQLDDDDLTHRDPRTGLQIERQQRTAAEGMLYTAEFLRLRQGAGLAVHVKGFNDLLTLDSQHPLVRLGGESRAAEYRLLPADATEALDRMFSSPPNWVVNQIRQTGRFKLYLSTPAVFADGWYPDFLDKETGRTKEPPFAHLVSAATEKPLTIGGYDLVEGRPRPARLAVPAGAAYHFVLDDKADAQKLVTVFHGKCLPTDANDAQDLHALGFGLALVGTWDYADGDPLT